MSTSTFLLSRSKLAQGSVSETKLRNLKCLLRWWLNVTLTLTQQTVSGLFLTTTQRPKSYPSEKKLSTPAKCREWINFIDDVNMPLHQEERAKLADFVVSHNDGEFLRVHSCQLFLRRTLISCPVCSTTCQ